MPSPAISARLRLAALALLLTLTSVAQACSASGGAQDAAHPDDRSVTVPGAAGRHDTLDWSKCDGDFECASLRVPLNYAEPAGATLSLAIARRRASNPGERIGSLLMNPGGPGGSAIDLIENDPLPTALSDRFDVVGFDPRGVGRSSPIDCHSNLQQMYDADPTLGRAADRSRYLSVSRSFVNECARKYRAELPYLGTVNVARDMDAVRQALGDERLTYVGYSYGTSIGEQYANLFPTRIRAMVLDGVVDPGLTGLQAAARQADGFEGVLDTFLADCASKSSCALTDAPGPVVDKVIASAERRAIPAPQADRPATPGVVQLALAQGLYAKELWPQLAKAIADAAGGNGSGLVDLANDYLQRRPNGTYSNAFEIYFAVNCLDSTWPRQPDAILAAGKAVGKRDPRLGEGLVNDYVRCALWPARPEPLPNVTAPGSPPIVVISTTNDPATPYASGVVVAKRLPKGVLVTNVGDGHTVFGQGKACVDGPVDNYLISLVPPRDGLRCS